MATTLHKSDSDAMNTRGARMRREVFPRATLSFIHTVARSIGNTYVYICISACSLHTLEARNINAKLINQPACNLFIQSNGTVVPQRIRVLRGIKDYRDVGRVIEFDGKPKLDIWSQDHCNEFNGTDSTIFPPFLTEADDIVSFSPDICRSLGATFRHKSKVKGKTQERK